MLNETLSALEEPASMELVIHKIETPLHAQRILAIVPDKERFLRKSLNADDREASSVFDSSHAQCVDSTEFASVGRFEEVRANSEVGINANDHESSMHVYRFASTSKAKAMPLHARTSYLL